LPGIDDEIARLVEDFGLESVMDSTCSSLPYGKQRLLEIALAIACEPKVLLLDEPAAGVPQADRQEVLKRLAKLPADVSVLLIEHDMDLVFSFANRISVLVSGALFAEGNVEEIASDPRVKEVYLGGGHHG
jgi:branched-chain amino acid transport system ATP-binding protein